MALVTCPSRSSVDIQIDCDIMIAIIAEVTVMDDVLLKQISIFIVVAESLSFSEAARTLYIAQPAVSRAIKSLEEDLGRTLFLRYNKGVALTPYGEFLYTELQPSFSKLKNSILEIKRSNTDEDYEFRIGCLNADEIISVFYEKLTQFVKLYPNVRLKVDMFSVDELRRAFLNEEINFAVSYYLGFGDYKDVNYLILKEKPVFYIIAKNSPAIVREKLDTNILNNYNLLLIAPSEVNAGEEHILRSCREQGFLPKKIKYMPTMLSIEMAIKKDQGFTLGTDSFLKHFPDDLRAFPVLSGRPVESISIHWCESNIQDFGKRFIESLVI